LNPGNENKYACPTCGNAFEAFKVDDTFKFASRYTCTENDYKSQSYSCPNCEEIITLYWHAEQHDVAEYNWEGTSLAKRILSRLF